MGIMLVVMIVILVVIFRNMKAAAEEQQARQARMQQQDKTRMTTHYAPTTASPVQQVAGQIHMSDVLPDKKPPAVPVKREDPRMTFTPTEGIPFHPPGFHGKETPKQPPRVSGSMEKKPLVKEDLGAQRAAQNAHTAQNLNWEAPKEAQTEQKTAEAKRRPMFTPGQLRDAFIMQEILDEPVSRRKGIKRGYGS